jgi:branched-chain amino acid transport system permease protein
MSVAPVLAVGSLSNTLQVILGGLATGGLYAVLLLGVVLVFQVSKNVNFAYGQVGVIGAFVSYVAYAVVHLPVPVALVLGVIAGGALAAVTDLALIRRIPERQGYDLVVTLGALLLLTAGTDVVFGAADRQFLPLLSDKATVVGGVYINAGDLLSLGLGSIALLAGYLTLDRTGLGVSLRASAEDPATTRAMGIDVLNLRTGVWAASGLLATIAAMVVASRLVLDARYMTPVIINVFIAGMLGGLDRYWPPMLAAFGVGLYNSLASYVFGSDAATPALFVLVIAVLIVAPKRFLEERYEARA